MILISQSNPFIYMNIYSSFFIFLSDLINAQICELLYFYICVSRFLMIKNKKHNTHKVGIIYGGDSFWHGIDVTCLLFFILLSLMKKLCRIEFLTAQHFCIDKYYVVEKILVEFQFFLNNNNNKKGENCMLKSIQFYWDVLCKLRMLLCKSCH